jgi:hypothetical protein
MIQNVVDGFEIMEAPVTGYAIEKIPFTENSDRNIANILPLW